MVRRGACFGDQSDSVPRNPIHHADGQVYVYGPRMPNLTVYIPRDLADDLAAVDVATSHVCQRALRRAIRLEQRRRSGDEMAIGVRDRLRHGAGTTNPAAS